MRSFTVTLTILMLSTTVAAGWEVKTPLDLITDEQKRSVKITNAQNHSINIYRTSNGKVWMTISLADQSFDQFDPERPPILRVDKLKPVRVDTAKTLQDKFKIPAYKWNPKFINYLAWHGKHEEGCGIIGDLMRGTRLVLRYYLSTGGYKDTIFDITGGRKELSEGLSLLPGACLREQVTTQNVPDSPTVKKSEVKLPKLSFINENKVLKNFPLEQATKHDVSREYGPPVNMTDSTWTYGQPDTKTFTFVFRGQRVYDVIVRYPGPFRPKTARKKQKLD